MVQHCIAAYVYGVVQGVGFRYTTSHKAKTLGLTGYARNLSDGSVELLICGEQVDIEYLLDWIKRGGVRHASVDRILTEPRPVADYQGFGIRY